MTEETLKEAIAEAERFLEKAKAVKWERRQIAGGLYGDKTYPYVDATKTAAAKRASMDLTRALARMRKP